MTDDKCGHPTADGEPCQHPTVDDGDPGRCWIDSHNEADVSEDKQPGREWAIDEDDHDEILEGARMGMSKAGCARLAGVDKASFQRYLDAHPDFRNAFTRARAQGEQRLIEGPLINDDDPTTPDIDGQHARFLLSTSFDYIKTEKQDVTMDAEIDHDVDKDTKERLAALMDRDVQQ